jgi:tetratricopeptide (TPR) repeat protein
MLAAQGHAAEAIDQYLRALEIEPNDLNAHYNLGNALLEAGRTDQAIVQFRKALEIKPDDADTYYNLGIALMRVGRPDEAISCFQKVIEFKPDSVGAYNNLALVLFTQGRFNEAVKEYQRTLELMPNYADAHYMLGCALQGQRKFDAAIVQFQEVLKLEPGQVMAQNSLAWLLATCPEATLRDGGKAIELAKQADQLSGGNHPEILDALAAAYAEAGRYPEAVETARRALSLLATQNNKPLADALQMRLKLYEANAPFHEKP